MVNPKYEIRNSKQMEACLPRTALPGDVTPFRIMPFVGDLAGRMTETPNSKILRFGNLVIWI